MTNEQILSAIEEYRTCFVNLCIEAETHPHDIKLSQHNNINADIKHCATMLDKMVDFVNEGKIEKAFRWLGFIQGVLWSRGLYTLDQLKEHNR